MRFTVTQGLYRVIGSDKYTVGLVLSEHSNHTIVAIV
jgi:hypothetical protein